MNFLLILLSIVFVFAFMRRWGGFSESFDGNCIKPLFPIFNQDNMSYENINYIYKSNTPEKVHSILTDYYNEDFDKEEIKDDMKDFLRHPIYNTDYKYLDRVNCKLDYFI